MRRVPVPGHPAIASNPPRRRGDPGAAGLLRFSPLPLHEGLTAGKMDAAALQGIRPETHIVQVATLPGRRACLQ